MRHLAYLGFMILIAALVFLLMLYVEWPMILEPRVVPSNNLDLQDWLLRFSNLAFYGIVASAAASLLWYVLGQWFFKVDDWRKANQRVIWGLLVFVPFLSFALSWFLTPPAQEGHFFAYICYLVNNLVIYILATVLFSPAAYKYTPLGASAIRRYW
jgi:hypothetical protein